MIAYWLANTVSHWLIGQSAVNCANVHDASAVGVKFGCVEPSGKVSRAGIDVVKVEG